MEMAMSHRKRKTSSPAQGGAEIIRPREFERAPGNLDKSPSFQEDEDDSAWLEQARRGDVLAQETLFDRHKQHVERLLYRMLGSDPDIADAMQDVFVEVFRNLHRLRDPSALSAWLRAVTVATARRRIRSRSRRRWLRFLPQEQLPEPAVEDTDDDVLAALRATYALLDDMSADLRIAFSLRHLEQLELTEVAQACDVSLATIKRRVKKSEDLFVARASRDPNLVDWVRRGARWEVEK
jgi:RNA polymerase sigma-70 factor, ECF subfamily